MPLLLVIMTSEYSISSSGGQCSPARQSYQLSSSRLPLWLCAVSGPINAGLANQHRPATTRKSLADLLFSALSRSMAFPDHPAHPARSDQLASPHFCHLRPSVGHRSPPLSTLAQFIQLASRSDRTHDGHQLLPPRSPSTSSRGARFALVPNTDALCDASLRSHDIPLDVCTRTGESVRVIPVDGNNSTHLHPSDFFSALFDNLRRTPNRPRWFSTTLRPTPTATPSPPLQIGRA